MAFLEVTIRYSRHAPHNVFSESLVPRQGDEEFTIDDPYRSRIRLQRRQAWPATYAIAVNSDVTVFGYGSQYPSDDDEFLQMALHSSGELFVRRDTKCTLPLFYGTDGDTFCLSNDYSTVLDRLQRLIPNESGMLNAFFGSGEDYQTQWKGIKILGENHILEVDAIGRIHIREPKPRSWISSRHAPRSEPKQFTAAFRATMEDFIARNLSGQRYAIEVSGGMDSSALPLYLSETRGKGQGLLASVLYEGDFYVTQQAKLNVLAEKTGFQVIQQPLISKAAHYPQLTNAAERPHYCHQGPYEAAFEELAKQLQRHGVTVIATGEGGDDCHENITSSEQYLGYGKSERQRRQEKSLPPFMTPLFRQKYIESTPAKSPMPAPQLCLSYHSSQVSINNTYIEHGIWPVSPYSDVRFYHFLQGIPAYLRKNKNITRLFFRAHQWPELIYRPEGNEHFSNFFNKALLSGAYETLINYYAQRGYLAQKGLIDGKKLQEYYQSCKQSTPADNYLLIILKWLLLEVNLSYKSAENF